MKRYACGPRVAAEQERLAYVALDYQAELAVAASSSAINKRYELPDGTAISVGAERFK